MAKARRKPPEPRRVRGLCTHGRKRAYSTERIARVAGARMSKAIGAAMRTYKCDHCGSWHLTHADPALQSRLHPIRKGAA